MTWENLQFTPEVDPSREIAYLPQSKNKKQSNPS